MVVGSWWGQVRHFKLWETGLKCSGIARKQQQKKKLMGRMPTDRQGGPKPPFSFTEISQQRSAGKQSPVHPSCQLCSKTIAPRMVLAVCYPARAGRHSSEQQVPVWSQQWFNPSPSARGEQELEPTELLSTARKTNGATSKSCLPTDTPERSLIVGLIQVLAVREREKHSPGALQDGISALDCPLWAQARCGWGSALSPWRSALCSLLGYSWC